MAKGKEEPLPSIFSPHPQAELLANNWKFLAWKKRIEQAGCKLLSVKVGHVIVKNESDFYSAFLECVMRTPEGIDMQRGLSIRGPAVVVIPLIEVDGLKGVQTLLVQQRRIANGDWSSEFPAGTLESHRDPAAVAIQEIREELGLEIKSEQLVPLTEAPIVAMTSAFDESVYWYAIKIHMTAERYRSFSGKATGVAREQEYIRVRLASLADVVNESNYQPLVGLSLLRRKGFA